MSVTRGERLPTRSVFHDAAFRTVFVADAVSVFGTQLARFALAVLVFDRTSSAAAAALTYATSFLPGVLGNAVLGGLGDRFSKRHVMIVAAWVSALLVGGIALPGVPVAAMVLLLAVAVFVDTAFGAAQMSYLADALAGERFASASAWRSASTQLTQVAGFGAGGAIVFVIGPRAAIGVDAATFAFAALLMTWFLAPDLPHRTDDRSARLLDRRMRPATTPSSASGDHFHGLWRDPRTRLHMTFTVLVGLFVLPEALAVSYGAAIGVDTVQAGILLAAIPAGSAVGCLVIAQLPAPRRRRLTGRLAAVCGLPLLVCAVQPNWPISVVAWFMCGLLTAYQVDVIAGLISAMPSARRARLIGVASSWLTAAQGICFALAGVAVELASPGVVIAVAGGLGSATAVVIGSGRRRHETASPLREATGSAA